MRGFLKPLEALGAPTADMCAGGLVRGPGGTLLFFFKPMWQVGWLRGPSTSQVPGEDSESGGMASWVCCGSWVPPRPTLALTCEGQQ